MKLDAVARYHARLEALHQELAAVAVRYVADPAQGQHPVFIVGSDRQAWLLEAVEALRATYMTIPSRHPSGRDLPPFPRVVLNVRKAHLSRAASASGRRVKKADLVRDLEAQAARMQVARQASRRQLADELLTLAGQLNQHASDEWSVIRRQSTEWRAEIETTDALLPLRVFIHRAGLILVGDAVAVDLPYHDLPGELRRSRRQHCNRLQDPEFTRGPFEYYAANRPPSDAWAARHAPAAASAPSAPALPQLPEINRPDVFDI